MRVVAFVSVALFLFACGSQPEVHSNTDSSDVDSALNDSAAGDTVAVDSVELRLPDSAFVPKQYRIEDVVFGNLNLDSFPDAMVMMRHDSDDVGMFSEKPRWIYLLLGTADGKFEVKIKNKNATFPQIEGQMFGDPYDGIEIDSGTFVIRHYGGSRYRWTSNFTFEYDPAKAEWYYTQHSSSEMDMLMEDTTVYKASLTVKNRMPFSTFSCENAEYSEIEGL